MLKLHWVIALALLLVLVAGISPHTADAGGRTLVADLSASGTSATGSAVFTLNQGQEEICFDITTTGLSGPVLADHIHVGIAGTNGPVQVSLGGALSGCVSADSGLIRDIRKNPTGYYVNLHTALNPGGEVRGQLDVPSEDDQGEDEQ